MLHATLATNAIVCPTCHCSYQVVVTQDNLVATTAHECNAFRQLVLILFSQFSKYIWLQYMTYYALQKQTTCMSQSCVPADSKMLLTACDDMHSHLYDVEHASLVEAFSGESTCHV